MNRDPRKEYAARLDARRASVARYDQRHRQIGNARLLAAIHEVEQTGCFVPLAELLLPAADGSVTHTPVAGGTP